MPADPSLLSPGAPTGITTGRLALRPPTAGDIETYLALHTDPRLYAHAPWALVRDPAQGEREFGGWLEHWAEHGFGYWVVTEAATGEPVGVAGVRVAAPGRLNLYYRFAARAHGRGYGSEAARAVTAHAAQWLPEATVEAVIRPGHEPSIRTARRAGLSLAGERLLAADPAGSSASLVYAAPRLHRVDDPGLLPREELLDLWQQVTEAGGSVGFLPGAPREEIAGALEGHARAMAAGQAFAGALRDPAGPLIGWAWWVRSPNPMLGHGLWLYRLMVAPDRQGTNLGALLMGGLIAMARRDRAELLVLSYRSGSGLGYFYGRVGFREVGRVPGAIRVALGDDRDEVMMARRVDGKPLVGDGRR